MDRRLQASFTIEAAYVMAVVFMCIVTAINFAYGQRDKVLGGFVAHEVLEAASHIEQKFDEDGNDIDAVTAYAIDRLSGIGGLSGSIVEIDRSQIDIKVNMTSASTQNDLSSKVFNPEGWMRKESVVRDFITSLKDGEKSENQEN